MKNYAVTVIRKARFGVQAESEEQAKELAPECANDLTEAGMLEWECEVVCDGEIPADALVEAPEQ